MALGRLCGVASELNLADLRARHSFQHESQNTSLDIGPVMPHTESNRFASHDGSRRALELLQLSRCTRPMNALSHCHGSCEHKTPTVWGQRPMHALGSIVYAASKRITTKHRSVLIAPPLRVLLGRCQSLCSGLSKPSKRQRCAATAATVPSTSTESRRLSASNLMRHWNATPLARSSSCGSRILMRSRGLESAAGADMFRESILPSKTAEKVSMSNSRIVQPEVRFQVSREKIQHITPPSAAIDVLGYAR